MNTNGQFVLNLKMMNISFGQQSGYDKHICFMCLWDSRATQRHWINKCWLTRKDLKVGKETIIGEQLVEREKAMLPPFHIKLG